MIIHRGTLMSLTKQIKNEKLVQQMAERETALVVWAKKKVSRSTGSVGCAETQRQDKIRTIEFSEFFL